MQNGDGEAQTLQSNPPEAAEGMILAGLDLKPIAADDGGRTILRELSAAAGALEGPLPGLPAEFADSLRAAEAEGLSVTTVRMSVGACDYSCRVFLLFPQNGTVSERLLAIYVEKDRSLLDAVRRVGRQYHLTAREQEALVGVSMGLTSRQLAIRMNISPNTVNAFLRLIMVKMGVTTRAGIVGKLINGKAAAAGGWAGGRTPR